MPKVNTRQSRGPRAPTIDQEYQTWTVQRLRDELSRYDIRPNTWFKKSGLIATLKAAIKDSETELNAPRVAGRRETRNRRHVPSSGDATTSREPSSIRHDVPVADHNVGMVDFTATLARLESSVSLLATTILQQQAPAAQSRDVTRDTPAAPIVTAPRATADGQDSRATSNDVTRDPAAGPSDVDRNPLPTAQSAGLTQGLSSGFEAPPGVPHVSPHGPSSQELWSTNVPAASSAAPMPPPARPAVRQPQLAGRPGAVVADDLPRVELVSPQLRQDILAGKDVNLASLLIPGYKGPGELEQRSLLIGQDVIPLKPLSDPRVNKALTITEFVRAFTVYKNVMCEVFPNREYELSCYLADIVEMASHFSGLTFYEYHKVFSAKAATWHAHGVSLDWSQRDTKLFTAMFAGHKANACSVCNSLSHHTSFCPLTPGDKSAESRSNRSSEAKISHFGPELSCWARKFAITTIHQMVALFQIAIAVTSALTVMSPILDFNAVLLNAQTPPLMLSRLLLVVNDLTFAITLTLANMILSNRSTTRFFSL